MAKKKVLLMGKAHDSRIPFDKLKLGPQQRGKRHNTTTLRSLKPSLLFLCLSAGFAVDHTAAFAFPTILKTKINKSPHPTIVRVALVPEETSRNSQPPDNPSSPVTSPADRFHADLERVLSRNAQDNDENDPLLSTESRYERRARPSVLTVDMDGAERADQMLQRMIHLGVASESSFALVMQAFVKRGRLRWKSSSEGTIICAADQVEALLKQLECQNDMISTETYNLVLEAYATCATPRGDRNYAKRADELLEQMETQDLANSQSLAHVLHAWAWQQANKGDGTCAQRAQDLLDRLENESRSNLDQNTTWMLIQCHDWVLEAWSKSKSKGFSQKANRVFERMKQLQTTLAKQEGLDDTHACHLPNTESYSNAILAWSKSPGLESATRAHELLLEMVDQFRQGGFPDSEPELIAFNGVITAWARQGRPDKAESILWLMDELAKECTKLVPDVLTYNAVLLALVKSSDKKLALEKSIEIVEHMETQSRDQPAIRPDSFTYNTLMKAWVQSGHDDAALQAEKILSKMESLGQSRNDPIYMATRNFNVLIDAYAKSKDRFAARKAHSLLKRMQDSTQVQPDIISFTSVIECYSKSPDPNASVIAEELLGDAFANYYANNKDPALMPNLRTFTMVILALSKSPRPGNAAKARALLEKLVKLHESTQDDRLKPNEYPYNYVLNCAANTLGTKEEKIEAFQIASKTYQDMRHSAFVTPDSFTYAFWIKASNNLLPKTKIYEKCVTLVFEECKRAGLVTPEVLKRLQQGGTPDMCQKLLGEEASASIGYQKMRVSDLHPSWTRNVKTKKR